MSRLLYEKSVSYKGYLIIPFVFGIANSQSIYSYKLLSELGLKQVNAIAPFVVGALAPKRSLQTHQNLANRCGISNRLAQ